MNLKAIREKIEAKREELREVFKQIKSTGDGSKAYDFQKAKADWFPSDVAKLEGEAKSMRIVELVAERNDEINELAEKAEALQKVEDAEKQLEKATKDDKKPVARPNHPGDKIEVKSFGQKIVEHPNFKMWAATGFDPPKCPAINIKDMGLNEIKTLFQTSAGWAPESIRTGQLVEAVTRPIQVMDIMPTGRTGQAAVVYMREDTRTHSAAEKAEGTTYAESEFVLSEQSATVRKVTDSVPVTDEQLEDVPMVESYLEGRLLFGVQQRLDGQVIAGNGSAPNLEGLLNVSGIQTQARGTDPRPDAIYKAMTKVRITGRAQPTHCLLHPTDKQTIRLLRTADGIYIWGSPAQSGIDRIWGLPMIDCESTSAGTAIVGSFMPSWLQLVERKGIVVDMGYVDDDFTKGRKTLRASGRWVAVWFRPAAFCTVTSL